MTDMDHVNGANITISQGTSSITRVRLFSLRPRFRRCSSQRPSAPCPRSANREDVEARGAAVQHSTTARPHRPSAQRADMAEQLGFLFVHRLSSCLLCHSGCGCMWCGVLWGPLLGRNCSMHAAAIHSVIPNNHWLFSPPHRKGEWGSGVANVVKQWTNRRVIGSGRNPACRGKKPVDPALPPSFLPSKKELLLKQKDGE